MTMLAWDRTSLHLDGHPKSLPMVPCHAVYLIAFPLLSDFPTTDAVCLVARSAGQHHDCMRRLQGGASEPTHLMEVADQITGGLIVVASTVRIGPEPFVYAPFTGAQADVARRVAAAVCLRCLRESESVQNVHTIPLTESETATYVR